MSQNKEWAKANLDYAHDRLMAAIEAIGQGKGLSDVANVSASYGKQTRIIDALNDAVEHLHEPFHDEHAPPVDAAFARLGLKRTSFLKDECALKLIAALKA